MGNSKGLFVEETVEDSSGQLSERQRSASWLPVITFVAGCYAATWLAWERVHSGAARGEMSACWGFLLVTVWSPTFLALATTMAFGGISGARILLRRLFRL